MSKVTVGNLPPEAKAQGTLNESTPAAQRESAAPTDVSSGPKLGETGEYLPASYDIGNGVIRVDR